MRVLAAGVVEADQVDGGGGTFPQPGLSFPGAKNALDALTRAKLQDELMRICEATKATTVMVTHDVDEAVLLSDRIVMMTNGPAATIGEILEVNLPRPRQRLTLAHDPAYIDYRAAVLEFLYEKQAHVEKMAA